MLCLEVLEHVSNQSAFIQNLLKLLKPTGILILSTINRTIKSYAHAIIAAEYILKWVPTNTHDYSKFLKPSELYKILEVNNFHLKNLTGLKFDIITNSWYFVTISRLMDCFSFVIPAKAGIQLDSRLRGSDGSLI